MNKFFVFLLLIVQASCSLKKNTESNKILSIVEKGTDSTYKREYYPTPNNSLNAIFAQYYLAPVETFISYQDIKKKEIDEIKTFMLNKQYGHYFRFYANGKMDLYSYYIGSSGSLCSFIRKFSKEGKILNEEGTPFVDYVKDEKGNLELHFTTVFFDSLSVEMSTKKIQWRKIALQKSMLLPMLLDGNEPASDSLFYFKITGFDKSVGYKRVFNDTLNINL